MKRNVLQRRIACAVLAGLMSLSMAGCSGAGDVKESSSSGASSVASEVSKVESSEVSKAEEKVVLSEAAKYLNQGEVG